MTTTESRQSDQRVSLLGNQQIAVNIIPPTPAMGEEEEENEEGQQNEEGRKGTETQLTTETKDSTRIEDMFCVCRPGNYMGIAKLSHCI